jgi:hypothetical protein
MVGPGRALCALAALVQGGGPALAQGDGREQVHGGGGIGGFRALVGPADYGPAAELEIYPGGRFGRYGVRAAWWGFEGASSGLVVGGVTFQAAAARPRLHLALHADAGAAYGEAAGVAIGVGAQTHLWLWGPLAIGIDTSALVVIGDGDPGLLLGSALTLRLAR